MRSSLSRLVLAALAALAALAPASAPARAQARVAGRAVAFAAETPHPYPTGRGASAVYRVTIEHPGATYISVHFDRFELGPGDEVVVRGGSRSHAYGGRGRGGRGAFWAAHVRGDQAVVELRSPARHAGAWGFSIDRYAAGTVDLAAAPETVCAPDDRRNAVCYQGTEADAYDHARPVARLLVEGQLLCTGFLVGCAGDLLTNNHCFNSTDPALSEPAVSAANTDYEFLAEAPDCGSTNDNAGAWPGTIWGGAATLVKTDETLDYALVHLDGDPQDLYGSLLLDDRTAVAGERVYLPQHGGGRAKLLGLDSSAPGDAGGVCRVFRNNEAPCSAGAPAEVGYFCDTDGGASGSPLLSHFDHRVIALHHCGGCPSNRNRATAIFRIIDDLGPLLPPSAVAGSSTCPDGVLECGELCDGSLLGGESCTTQGFTSGNLSCNASCSGFNTLSCASTCGDAAIAPDEACEVANLNGESCASLEFAGGSLACGASCDAFDTSGCFSVCGDALVSPDEACDGSDLDGRSCATEGLDSGTVSCTAGCTSVDTSACCGPVDITVGCKLDDSGDPMVCEAGDRLLFAFHKPSPAGMGLDLYRADEGDLFPGAIGPVDCIFNDMLRTVPPATPLEIMAPAFAVARGQVDYYLIACHQCGGLIDTGLSRFGGIDTERVIGQACESCP